MDKRTVIFSPTVFVARRRRVVAEMLTLKVKVEVVDVPRLTWTVSDIGGVVAKLVGFQITWIVPDLLID